MIGSEFIAEVGSAADSRRQLLARLRGRVFFEAAEARAGAHLDKISVSILIDQSFRRAASLPDLPPPPPWPLGPVTLSAEKVGIP